MPKNSNIKILIGNIFKLSILIKPISNQIPTNVTLLVNQFFYPRDWFRIEIPQQDLVGIWGRL